jgi:glycine hydroxymethyltransferase
MDVEGGVLDDAMVYRRNNAMYLVVVNAANDDKLWTWLRALSDGYVEFDSEDLRRKPAGPIVVRLEAGPESLPEVTAEADGSDKPWYLGASGSEGSPLPAFEFEEAENAPPKRTALFEAHKSLGAKIIPFAGWEMPLWYGSVLEEHSATRTAAGLFDVSHMGVYQVEGEQANYGRGGWCTG